MGEWHLRGMDKKVALEGKMSALRMSLTDADGGSFSFAQKDFPVGVGSGWRLGSCFAQVKGKTWNT